MTLKQLINNWMLAVTAFVLFIILFPIGMLYSIYKTINKSTSIAEGISKTLFAVSNDELRPAMTGVYFQLDDNGITFVATDAHKLVKYNHSEIKGGNASFIVPKKALNLLKAVTFLLEQILLILQINGQL